MYTQEEYLNGWLLYLAGVAIVMICGWLWTAKLRYPDLKVLLRLGVFVFLIVPWFASSDLEALAPAWIIAIFEGVFDGPEAFWRAGTPLVLAVGTTLGVTLIVQIVRRLRRTRRHEQPHAEAAPSSH